MYKVAIIDDDRIIRKGLANTIAWEDNGFRLVGEAADGEQGLKMIEEFCPQVVVSDIRMPFMDGLQLSKIIREHMPWIKIIILSGYDEFGYAQTAKKKSACTKRFFCVMNRDTSTIPIESAILMCRFQRRLPGHNPLSSEAEAHPAS